MAQSKKLTLGNHIYLYQVLSSQIPCGRQTFIPQVESVLAEADLAAADLGFESTRELLEELDDCIKLTVFKGGRIYATIIAQPAWDEALAASSKKSDAPQGKSWKKKRGDKSLKAVRPRHVPKAPKPKPEPEPVAEAETEAVAETAAEAAVADSAAVHTAEPAAEQSGTATDETPQDEPSTADEASMDASRKGTESAPESDSLDAETREEGPATTEDSSAPEPEQQPQPETPRPAVSLKVLYDPDNANAGATTLESTPYEAPAPATNTEDDVLVALPITRIAEPEPKAATAQTTSRPGVKPNSSAPASKSANPVAESVSVHSAAPAPQSTPVQPAELNPGHATAPAAVPAPAPKPAFSFESYPTDFHAEVFCPGPQLSELSALLPWGADALGIAGEYYWIARENGSIEASRSHAVFPLRYTLDGKRHEVRIEMRRRNGAGASWAIEAVHAEDEPGKTDAE